MQCRVLRLRCWLSSCMRNSHVSTCATLPHPAYALNEHTSCFPQASLEDISSSAAASASVQQEPGPLRKGSAICALEQELLSASEAVEHPAGA